MAELAEMASIPTSVSVQKATLGKTVKATSANVDQIPVNMMHDVTMKPTGTDVTVCKATLETTVTPILMNVPVGHVSMGHV